MAFALSGWLEAACKRLDAVGVCMVAGLAAFGGGALSYVLLDPRLFLWVEHALWLGALLLLYIGAIRFMQARHFAPTVLAMHWPDAAGLALFTGAARRSRYVPAARPSSRCSRRIATHQWRSPKRKALAALATRSIVAFAAQPLAAAPPCRLASTAFPGTLQPFKKMVEMFLGRGIQFHPNGRVQQPLDQDFDTPLERNPQARGCF